MGYCFNPTCQHPQNFSDTAVCQICGTPLLLNFQEGDTRVQYRGLKLIGQGGFGRTFLAANESQPLQRCVIKQFFQKGADAEKAATLFYQEAQQLKVLGKHPQIPQWIAHFEQDGYQYLVQEFVEGNNLAQELAKKGVFNETQIRQLLKELLPVLQFIHSHKVIHRDIKPDNIIRRSTHPDLPSLVLVDFGAAKVVKGGSLPLTGTVIGSAAYTAPEQLMGKAVFASDLYSLGVTCIHLLTQVPPFDLFDSGEGNWIWRDYLKTPISNDFGQILDKMLQSATKRRYHSAAAVLRHLEPPLMVGDTPYRITPPVAIIPEETSVTPSTALVVATAESTLTPQTSLEEAQQVLQELLVPYSLKIQVNQVKNTLILVINRLESTRIDYPELTQIILAKLSRLKLNRVKHIKIIGRVSNQKSPEWRQVLKLDRKAKLKNQLIRAKNSSTASKIVQFSNPQYLLSRLKDKDFVMNVLMFNFIGYIFSYQVAWMNPFIGLLVAAGFIGVKNAKFRPQDPGMNHLLFITVAAVFIILGIGGIRIRTTGVFSLMLAGLFIALPLLYIRPDSHQN